MKLLWCLRDSECHESVALGWRRPVSLGKTDNRANMSSPILPTKSDAERAIQRLKASEQQFNEALNFHETETKGGSERASEAAYKLSRASRVYRLALLDPHLPPI